jgi:rhodanese-related sulfurtransferase
MTPAAVKARLGEPDFFVFDCNLESLWKKSHIPGAIYLGFDRFEPEMLPSDKRATLVFYCLCHLCLASNMAARRAQSFGYKRVRIMPKGTMGWKSAGFALVPVFGSSGTTANADKEDPASAMSGPS